MDWSQQLLDSLWWIMKSMALVAIFFSLTVAILSKTTQWGQQFWQLTQGYISPKRSVKPLLYFVIIIFFELLSVRINILVSEWYNQIYNALQEMNVANFWQQMGVFAALATVNISNVLLSYYLSKRFTIQWRYWLNEQLVAKWSNNQAYYKTQFIYNQLDNPDQRIQQDVQSYVNSSLDFATGVISSVVSIVAFTIILWGLSGPMSIAGVEIPHMMVFLVFAYVLLNSLIAFKIGRPLIKLNFANERLNANYRYSLIRLKEYAESIAFYRGEKMEQSILAHQFSQVIDNIWKIVYRSLKLSGFNLMISQISVVFPLIIQAGRYFSQQIKFGDLMQTAQVFGRLHGALSFFRNSYDDFAAYRATLARLTGFNQAIEQATQTSVIQIENQGNQVIFKDLSVQDPTGKSLITNLNLSLNQGESLLIQGASGVGKTTLLRTIAGLWPYAEGKIICPSKRLFLSQKPYLPQGRLIDALCYPDMAEDNIDVSTLQEILQQVQLGHLSEKLLEENDWTRVLSLGEQQRLAFARLLFQQPEVAFLDEATASMDEGLEDSMYRLLQQRLPQMTMISVGHRSSLIAHHQRQLLIENN